MADTKDNFYKVNTWYSFTLNPSDKFQFYGKMDRLKRFRNFFYELFLSIKFTYEVFIEISEPRGMQRDTYKGPRLHMHGKVRFETSKQLGTFLLIDFYKFTRVALVDIDTISDPLVWYQYCTKQRLFKKNRLSSFDR